MRTENFEINLKDDEYGVHHHFGVRDPESKIWSYICIDSTEQLRELKALLGRYLGNLSFGGDITLDLREDG